MANKLVKKIREIENQIILLSNDNSISFKERNEKIWELQSRLRLAHTRLVEAVEAQG